jgi:hypothetical protein
LPAVNKTGGWLKAMYYMVCSLLARLASKIRKTSTGVYLLLFLFLLKEMASLARSP